MTTYGTDTTTARIEQRYAMGDVPDEIALRLGVKLAEVLRVGEAMDAAARQADDPRRDWEPTPGRRRQCQRGHYLTDDNVTGPGRRECVTCKRRRDKKARPAA